MLVLSLVDSAIIGAAIVGVTSLVNLDLAIGLGFTFFCFSADSSKIVKRFLVKLANFLRSKSSDFTEVPPPPKAKKVLFLSS